MAIKKIEGIVLSETNYSESSKILNIFTKELGIIGVISKGCRKVKSKLRTISNNLTYGDFNLYYKEDGLSTLISCDTKVFFKNILTDITKIGFATYIVELATQTYKQNNDSEIYDLLISSLNKIEEGLDPLIITDILELKYLDYLGIGVNLDSCNLCGSTEDIVTFSCDAGGYVCRNCYTNELVVSSKSIKVLRMFYYVDIDRISKLDLANQTVKEITAFLDDYYDKYSGLYLKSKKFLEQFDSNKKE